MIDFVQIEAFADGMEQGVKKERARVAGLLPCYLERLRVAEGIAAYIRREELRLFDESQVGTAAGEALIKKEIKRIHRLYIQRATEAGDIRREIDNGPKTERQG